LRERTLFATEIRTKIIQYNVHMSGIQVARKGITPIELATLKTEQTDTRNAMSLYKNIKAIQHKLIKEQND